MNVTHLTFYDEFGNARDLIESGSAVPELLFGGVNSATYSVRTFDWYRLADIRFVTIVMILASKGTATGVATVRFPGLPNPLWTVSFLVQANNLQASAGTGLQGVVLPGATIINLQRYANGAATPMADTDFKDNSILRATFFYKG